MIAVVCALAHSPFVGFVAALLLMAWVVLRYDQRHHRR